MCKIIKAVHACHVEQIKKKLGKLGEKLCLANQNKVEGCEKLDLMHSTILAQMNGFGSVQDRTKC